jgi:hypothetical protein
MLLFPWCWVSILWWWLPIIPTCTVVGVPRIITVITAPRLIIIILVTARPIRIRCIWIVLAIFLALAA